MNTLSIADALFPKVAQRVLAALYGNPDRSYYTKELIRQVDSGNGAVHRELIKLTAAGLVSVRAIGNQKHYQANRQSPVFNELHGLAIKTFGMADVLRQGLLPLASEILFALIYGSVAKGVEKSTSDVDLLIVSDTLTFFTVLEAVMPMEAQLGRPIHPTLYSMAEFQKKRETGNHFLTSILTQPIIPLFGNCHVHSFG